MTAHLIAVGAEAGIPFAMDRITVSPNTRLAHAVIAGARGTGCEEAVVDALFTGYFCEGVDITDPEALVGLLERARGDLTAGAALVADAVAGRSTPGRCGSCDRRRDRGAGGAGVHRRRGPRHRRRAATTRDAPS